MDWVIYREHFEAFVSGNIMKSLLGFSVMGFFGTFITIFLSNADRARRKTALQVCLAVFLIIVTIMLSVPYLQMTQAIKANEMKNLTQQEKADLLIKEGNKLTDKIFSLNEKKDLRDAIKKYDEALQLSPENDWGHARRGMAHRRLGEYANAIGNLQKAISISSEYAWAHYQLALCYFEQGLYEDALNNYNIAIELAEKHNLSNFSFYYRNRAKTYAALAKADRRKADELNKE